MKSKNKGKVPLEVVERLFLDHIDKVDINDAYCKVFVEFSSTLYFSYNTQSLRSFGIRGDIPVAGSWRKRNKLYNKIREAYYEHKHQEDVGRLMDILEEEEL